MTAIRCGGSDGVGGAASKQPDDLRFWPARTQIAEFSVALALQCAAVGAEEAVDQDLIAELELVFTSMACVLASFQAPGVGRQSCTERHSNVDMAAVAEAFDAVARVENETLQQIVSNA